MCTKHWEADGNHSSLFLFNIGLVQRGRREFAPLSFYSRVDDTMRLSLKIYSRD